MCYGNGEKIPTIIIMDQAGQVVISIYLGTHGNLNQFSMVPMMIPIEDPVMGFCGGSFWVPTGAMARIAVRGLLFAAISRLMGMTIARRAARRSRG